MKIGSRLALTSLCWHLSFRLVFNAILFKQALRTICVLRLQRSLGSTGCLPHGGQGSCWSVSHPEGQLRRDTQREQEAPPAAKGA